MGNNCCQNQTEGAPETTLVTLREMITSGKAQQQEKEGLVTQARPPLTDLRPRPKILDQAKSSFGSNKELNPSVENLTVFPAVGKPHQPVDLVTEERTKLPKVPSHSREWVKSGEIPAYRLKARINRKSNVAFLVSHTLLPEKTNPHNLSDSLCEHNSEVSESSVEAETGSLTIAKQLR